MNTRSRFALAVLALCTPIVVAAAAPSSVTGIKAELQNGKVFVSWTPINDPSITAYHVFYSHASILGSNGLYDDYDSVEGSVNSYTIPNTPQAQTLYVSVMAENAAGEESPYFAEEANVQLSDKPVASSAPAVIPSSSASSKAAVSAMSMMSVMPPASSAPAQQTDAQLQLLSVRTLSATGVELTFSHAVSIDPSAATKAFTIETGSGDALTLTRLTTLGNIVHIDTLPQERGTVYVLILGQGITGINPDTATTIPLDPAQAPMLFIGDPSGIAPHTSPAKSSSSSVSSATLPLHTGDVLLLTLRATPEKKGFYTINAAWSSDRDGTITGFQISQTTDKGRTYSQPNSIPASAQSISIPHVPAGNFGLLVRAVYADGTLSKGILKTVALANTGTVPPVGSVIGKPTNGQLPHSGPAAWTLFAMIGSAAGYATMKRLNAAKA